MNTVPADSEVNQYIFNMQKPYGPPETLKSVRSGKTAVAVQFVIPGLHLSDRNGAESLARSCRPGLIGFKMAICDATDQDNTCTYFEAAFPISAPISNSPSQPTESEGLLFVERFTSLLSFSFGHYLPYVNAQVTMRDADGTCRLVLRPVSQQPSRHTLPSIPPCVQNRQDLKPEQFSAISWLRRGMTEDDPLNTFSALTVCLQVCARSLVTSSTTPVACPKCGAEIRSGGPGISQQVRLLVVERLGHTEELFDRIWKARNSVTAHGNQPFDPTLFASLTELRLDTLPIAWAAVRLLLGIPTDTGPELDPSIFVTDAFMHAH